MGVKQKKPTSKTLTSLLVGLIRYAFGISFLRQRNYPSAYAYTPRQSVRPVGFKSTEKTGRLFTTTNKTKEHNEQQNNNVNRR